MSRIIALLTDYGYTDTYVAQVKAVLWSLCPTCEILDLTHGVAPQNVRSGAYLLATATPYLPDGTIVIAVVDPGVGTERRAVAVQGARHIYLAPDNGLLSLALRDDPPTLAVSLDNPRYHLPQVSATFHGRDIFAPCAAHLANGVPLRALGTAIDTASLATLPDMEPEFLGDVIRCKPLHIDHFGNVVFNLRSTDIPVRDSTPDACTEESVDTTGVKLGVDTTVSATVSDDSTDTITRTTETETRTDTITRATETELSTDKNVRATKTETRTDKNVRATVRLPLVRTFGEVAWGEPLAYWGSNGYLEIAVNGGSAAERLQVSEASVLELQIETNAF
ncbi:MAG: S-adenosyl-l-methionine hydroxide adenosyltransferase family protein [Fimbriimonadales bacterium]